MRRCVKCGLIYDPSELICPDCGCEDYEPVELPTPAEMRGMSPDFTGGMMSGEYVHQLREP